MWPAPAHSIECLLIQAMIVITAFILSGDTSLPLRNGTAKEWLSAQVA